MNVHDANIFIVEDDIFFGNMVKELLLRNNYGNIKLYDSGEKCLENIHRMPDIVILDHRLGEMNGLEVLKQIKKTNPNIQVIFLSGQEKMNVAVSALKYGAFDYLEKNGQGLKRLIHLIPRILYFNELVDENKSIKKFKLLFVASTIVLVSLIIYFNRDHIF